MTRQPEIALLGSEQSIEDSDLWIGSTGASTHMVCSDANMFYTKPSKINVIMGDGRGIKVSKTGKLRVKFAGRDGKITEILMRDVKYIPSLTVNLFSLTVALQRGAKIYSEGTSVILEKEFSLTTICRLEQAL